MADAKPFAFSQFVPGFEFLRSLAGGGAGGAAPGLPGLSNWVAPTLSVEELDKRISELKTVQYWLEQNGHALKATIQALEVQKMTLSTLKGMNVRMEDLANTFARSTASAAEAMRGAAGGMAPSAAVPVTAPAPEPAPEPEPAAEAPAGADDGTASPSARAPRGARKAEGVAAKGVVDTLQWWNALTQQFQQIASNALQEAAQMGQPPKAGGAEAAPAAGRAPAAKRGAAAKRTAAAPSARRAPAARKKPAAAPAATRKR